MPPAAALAAVVLLVIEGISLAVAAFVVCSTAC